MFQQVEVSFFCYATESPEKVSSAVLSIAPGMRFNREEKLGSYGVPIQVFSGTLTKDYEIDEFFKRLGHAVMEEILSSLERRVDDRGILYFRMDKQSLVLGKCVLATGGDVVLVKCKPRINIHAPIFEDIRSYLSQIMKEIPTEKI